MTEQQQIEAHPGPRVESFYEFKNPTPSPSRRRLSFVRPRSGKAILDPSGRAKRPYHRRAAAILSNLANDYGGRCQRSDKTDVSGFRQVGMQKASSPGRFKRALIITVVPICISDWRWWRSRAIR